jgi:hypothetical protein
MSKLKSTGKRLRSWLSAATIVLLLSGCVTEASDGRSVTIKIECPVLVQYDKALQSKIADELDELPAGSPLRQLVNDYLKLRDICRKIKGSK